MRTLLLPHPQRVGRLAFLALVLTPRSAAQGPSYLDPMEFTSPSGRYVLQVDPSEPDGAGPGDHALRDRGEVVWRARHPFTVQEAIVTDEGRVLGAAYANGWGLGLGGGEIVVAVLSREGEVVLLESGTGDASADRAPDRGRVEGIVRQDSDRALIRVWNGKARVWWTYDLEAPKRLGTIVPKGPEGITSALLAAREVRGTSLVVGLWTVLDGRREGLVYGLVDGEGSWVWSQSVMADRSDFSDRQGRAYFDHVRTGGGIPAAPPGSFTIVRHTEHEAVTYSVRRDGAGEWTVQEAGRRPHEWRSPEVPEAPPAPPIELELLGEAPLEAAPAKPEVFVAAWHVLEDGIQAIHWTDGGPSVWVHVAMDGRELARAVVPLPEDLPSGIEDWLALADGSWLVTHSARGGSARAWRFDPGAGTLVELTDLRSARVELTEALPDGGFVSRASVYDADGRRRRGIRGRNPEDVALTTEGELAALYRGLAEVHLVDSVTGETLRTIDLEQVLGVEPNDLDGIEAAPGGGLLLYDFDGDPNLWWIDAAGKAAAPVRLIFPGGLVTEKLAGDARYGPDGHLWSCDGRAFVRFGEDGVADLVVGEPTADDRLEEPNDARGGPGGRLYVFDGRDGEVQVFGRDGHFLHRCRPDPADLWEVPTFTRFAVDGAGHVFLARDEIEHEEGFVHFDARGRRLGIRAFEGGLLTFRPGTREGWAGALDEVVQFAADGTSVRRLRRRADRTWMRFVDAVAAGADGSVAVLDGSLTIVEPDGTPRVTYHVPAHGQEVARGRGWIANGGWSLAYIHLIRESDGARFRIAGAEEDRDVQVDLTNPPEGDELWIFERERRVLRRYAWPEGGR